ncbi:MAG TPA: site-specific integrase [Candidatus Sulfotelmatobacter sp.]|nr:site-specific integrase [Candidatus Sulfotelmatobacter sp.]
MSRRTGQEGHIEKSGKWYVVRWWQDVPGQYERSHRRARICPISGAGALSKSERQRRAREIIAESGADTVEHFNKVVQQQKVRVVTFKEQAACWLERLRSRKRKPVSSRTIDDWEGVLNNWINPAIGDCPISDVNNGVLKKVVAAMVDKGLSPKTIENYVQVPKMVVASVEDDDGNLVYPRKWNHEFMDMPLVEKAKQNTPSFSSEVMSGLAKWEKPKERMLFVLCGAGGFRISEVLGVEIDKHISSDFRTIRVRQQAQHCKVREKLKTTNALRDVDIHPDIAALLKAFVGDRKSGFLLASRNGKPLSSSNIIRRHLHPALKQLAYVNSHTGTHKAGNHAFRRFRNTFLRNYTACPEGLYKFWMGHAGKDMSDLYDKIKEDVAFRRKWAEQCGFGFELPSVVPNVPRITEQAEAANAA